MNPITTTAPSGTQRDYAYRLKFGRMQRLPAAALEGCAEADWVDVPPPGAETRSELDEAFTRLIDGESELALVDEYAAWCGQQGVPHVSADEQHLPDLSTEQRWYVHHFILRWEFAVDSRHPRPGERLSYGAWCLGEIRQACS